MQVAETIFVSDSVTASLSTKGLFVPFRTYASCARTLTVFPEAQQQDTFFLGSDNGKNWWPTYMVAFSSRTTCKICTILDASIH